MIVYIVFRDGEPIGIAKPPGCSYTDRHVPPGEHHYVIMTWRTDLPISSSIKVRV